MGTAEIANNQIIIVSHIITYGTAADSTITELIRDEIETMWNEPQANLFLNDTTVSVRFLITGSFQPNLVEQDILENTDPRNNYFRIEEFALDNISFVDESEFNSGSNTGYFLLKNLSKGSTTAAHEYGHTLGLDHPDVLDLRGKGVPGIMYPRGTLVDPQFQYDPGKPAGQPGGTMNPVHRRVLQQDIENLALAHLSFTNSTGILGDFTSIWHPNHAEIGPGELP
ncbi:MAG: peptidase M10 [Chitinophagaceae bacterium]